MGTEQAAYVRSSDCGDKKAVKDKDSNGEPAHELRL